MCAQQICHFEILQLVRGPVQLLIARGEEVKPTDNGLNRLVGEPIVSER
jgi:hypothetical protein